MSDGPTRRAGLAAFPRRYGAALRVHVKAGADPRNGAASRLGLRACELGIGTLALARIHDLALACLAPPGRGTGRRPSLAVRAASFFAEALVPIEATHRPAVEALAECRRLGKSIDRGTADLAIERRRVGREKGRRLVLQRTLKENDCEHRILLERSRAMEEQLRLLSRRLLRSHEDERRRISRELHDALGQTLSGINLGLATLKSEMASSSKGIRGNISKTRRLVQQSMKTVHQFARDLRPTLLDDLGLVPALQSLTREFARGSRVRTRLSASEGSSRLAPDSSTALYRVAQEALTNVGRHARARNVRVTLREFPRTLRMAIWNDGRSFDLKRLRRSGRSHRLGILCMQERVEMVGGTFAIESSPANGTTVRAEVPLGAGAVG